MATKPMAWQERGSVNSQDEWVNESRAQGEVVAIISHNSPVQDKKAPRAEPEEDIDVLEPGAQQENQTLSRAEITDAIKLEKQELTRISLCTPRETQEMVTELEQVAQRSEALQACEEAHEEFVDLCEDAFPPPPPLSALITQDCYKKDGFSCLDGEVAEWISNAEIISEPTEDLPSPDSWNSQEWPPLLTESVDIEIDLTSEEMTQQNFLPDGFDNSEAENIISGAAFAGRNSTAHLSSSDRNNSDDEYTICSPPFADESEEEEKVSIDMMSCQQQLTRLDNRIKHFQPSSSASISVSTEQDPTSTVPAVPPVKQQEELLSQSQYEPVPKRANPEAAQQVLSQSCSPLSTVVMELSYQGGADSQGSGCVVAVRERHSRVGERTDGESKQTGGEEGQKKERGLEGNKTVGQQRSGGLLKFSKTVRTQEFRTEKYKLVSSKHTRMESDLCDDSQSDSGLSADFSPSSTLEGNTTISTVTPAAIPKETPIEREIRRAIAREHSLRRSRGLPNPPTSPEYVEIPLRKTVLCQSLTTKSERCQGKDRLLAGKKMQHEIHEEVQREQDLVRLGKIPGFYDKGTIRQLKERKQLFEAFQKPNDSTLTVSSRSKATSWSSASDISILENENDISSQASTIGGSNVDRITTQSPNSVKAGGSTSLTPRGFSEGTGCQVIILENNLSVPAHKRYHAKPEAEPVTAVDSGSPNLSSFNTGGHGGIKGREQENEEEEEEVAPRENPFFKLRSSTNLVKVEQDIREAKEREKELHKQRISVYGGTKGAKGGGVGGGGGGGRPISIERKSPTLSSSSSMNGLAVPDLPGSSSTGVNGPPAAHQSVGRFGMWPPAQVEEQKINRPEVLYSPRTPRQKTPLVQRWESGLVNGHNEEDD